MNAVRCATCEREALPVERLGSLAFCSGTCAGLRWCGWCGAFVPRAWASHGAAHEQEIAPDAITRLAIALDKWIEVPSSPRVGNAIARVVEAIDDANRARAARRLRRRWIAGVHLGLERST